MNKLGKARILAAALMAFCAALAGLGLLSCRPRAQDAASDKAEGTSGSNGSTTRSVGESEAARLESLAESERSSGFKPGMGLAESSLLEAAGDYSGAVLAAFKELLYARGLGFIDEKTARARLDALSSAFGSRSDASAKDASAAAEAARSFQAGRWASARKALEASCLKTACGDDFARWMLLACVLSEHPGDRKARAEYSSIRARYERFPEYWLIAARCGIPDAAERCVALAPGGASALEARALMASDVGLAPKDGERLLCRVEIESAARDLAAAQDARRVSVFFPLLSLPDNPYTLYALGALKALASDRHFQRALADAGKAHGGRLGERLRYAAGGVR